MLAIPVLAAMLHASSAGQFSFFSQIDNQESRAAFGRIHSTSIFGPLERERHLFSASCPINVVVKCHLQIWTLVRDLMKMLASNRATETAQTCCAQCLFDLPQFFLRKLLSIETSSKDSGKKNIFAR